MCAKTIFLLTFKSSPFCQRTWKPIYAIFGFLACLRANAPVGRCNSSDFRLSFCSQGGEDLLQQGNVSPGCSSQLRSSPVAWFHRTAHLDFKPELISARTFSFGDALSFWLSAAPWFATLLLVKVSTECPLTTGTGLNAINANIVHSTWNCRVVRTDLPKLHTKMKYLFLWSGPTSELETYKSVLGFTARTTLHLTYCWSNLLYTDSSAIFFPANAKSFYNCRHQWLYSPHHQNEHRT